MMGTERAAVDAVADRLRRSRLELFEIAHEVKGDRAPGGVGAGFPRSRLMRALTGSGGRVALGSAALAVAASRPGLMFKAMRLLPPLRPFVWRYLLSKLLR